MFIELTDLLRCPADHPEQVLVLLPEHMSGRAVITGTLGCPVCGRTYTIADGIARFGPAPAVSTESQALTAEAIETFLGLSGPGGYIVVVGGAEAVGHAVAERVDGVHVVQLNPGDPGPGHRRVSVLEAEAIPLKARSVRGAVLGRGYAALPHWLDEAERIVLPGRRLVGEGDLRAATARESLEVVASGAGVWVADVRAG